MQENMVTALVITPYNGTVISSLQLVFLKKKNYTQRAINQGCKRVILIKLFDLSGIFYLNKILLFKFYYILKDDRKLPTPKIKFQYCFKAIIKKNNDFNCDFNWHKNYQEIFLKLEFN